ncbi:MAG: hypothetical protein ACI9WU_003357 [Myxococcota bacterium]|jgi:hypothetical protein
MCGNNTYETALRKRGDITFWFNEKAIEAWKASSSGRPGGTPTWRS